MHKVQASCRALVVDSLPASQQHIGSAWGKGSHFCILVKLSSNASTAAASRMIAIGNLVGYFVYVFLPTLPSWPSLKFTSGTLDMKTIFGTTFGDTQIKQLCVLSFVALLATVLVTSISVTERVLVTRRCAPHLQERYLGGDINEFC